MRTYWTPERDSAYRLCEQALQIDPENVLALSHTDCVMLSRDSPPLPRGQATALRIVRPSPAIRA